MQGVNTRSQKPCSLAPDCPVVSKLELSDGFLDFLLGVDIFCQIISETCGVQVFISNDSAAFIEGSVANQRMPPGPVPHTTASRIPPPPSAGSTRAVFACLLSYPPRPRIRPRL